MVLATCLAYSTYAQAFTCRKPRESLQIYHRVVLAFLRRFPSNRLKPMHRQPVFPFWVVQSTIGCGSIGEGSSSPRRYLQRVHRHQLKDHGIFRASSHGNCQSTTWRIESPRMNWQEMNAVCRSHTGIFAVAHGAMTIWSQPRLAFGGRLNAGHPGAISLSKTAFFSAHAVPVI